MQCIFSRNTFNVFYSTLLTLCTAMLICIWPFSSLYASPTLSTTPEACQPQIQHIAAAKGNPQQETVRPTTGWVDLEKLPDQWVQRWPNFQGPVWYQIRWHYHCTEKQPVSLTIEGITQSGKVYVNDDLLWQDIALKEPMSRNQFQPHLWNIPQSSLHQGDNTLWIQVYGGPIQKSGLGRIKIGLHPEINAIYSSWILEKRTLPLFNIMINSVIGLFCLLVWLFTHKENAFKWFAIVSFAWVAYCAALLYSAPVPWLNTIQLEKIHHIIFCFYVTVGCVAAWRFAQFRFKRLEKALFIFSFLAMICIGFSPTAYAAVVIKIFFSLAVLIFMAKCLTYSVLAYKSKLKETYFLALTYLVFFPIAIHDALFIINMDGRPLSPYTAPFSSITVGIILALRLARHSKKIERFNKTLADNIIQTKQELTQSLNQQHHLALENARLQERIHLSHDLHDGLGGSIVRSILLLERNDKVEKPQIMSMLKLLRNDLRQVIDSGSSIGTNAPETPVEWGAPIRHRFVQLFEELDIQSRWTFENQWQTMPLAKQCLTLTRVAEEALTNILKHSQATEVMVSLSESDHKLILQIQDNGIGFDPATVEQGLHVGLHSMCTRISRIGGEFKIDSEPGHTTIQAILPLTESKQMTAMD
ncbi:histidine kinase [Acinetobacter sp. ANC 4169]|uniref:sensor histidine kinase n=1 Tax=Acinetobacter sp. ANC 4169 TaxID=1977879 RepID=UPI000A33EB5F|nr:ATP-binding protein [Acinetobacter sp. ANC 4169]OTG72287.1 histidine kinase [Acinetobacter sp. ANC 4169]